MKTVRLLLTLGVAALAIASAASEPGFQEHEHAWAAAVMARDFPALERLFADSLIYAHSTGAIESKREYLERLKTGAQVYEHITIEKNRFVPYGEAAVSHSIVRMDGVSNGKPFNDHVMMMHLWVRQNGHWRIAAHQTTKLPQ